MQYTVDFCIISTFYLGLTSFFYIRQNKVRTPRNRLFGVLLLLGIANLGLDIVAALIDPIAYSMPGWFVYAVNMLFLSCAQINGPVFFFYTLVLAGFYPKLSLKKRHLLLLPAAVSILLLLLSPFGRWSVFYLDEQNIYHHGAAHIMLYINIAFYLVSGGAACVAAGGRIQLRKRVTVLGFLAVTLIAMLIQLNNPYLLVNSMANALALTLMYHMLQSPGEHVDRLTGVFNRAALPMLVSELYEQNQEFDVLVVKMSNLGLINQTAGMKSGDMVLRGLSEYLIKTFYGCNIVRIYGDIFAVIEENGRADGQRLESVLGALPVKWQGENGDVLLYCTIAGINSDDCADAGVMLDVLAAQMEQHGSSGEKRVTLCDTAFLDDMKRRKAMEEALMRAINEDRVEVYYQPIHDSWGGLVALEALARITDPELGPLRPDIFICMAEKNGSITQLGEQVLRKVCAFIKQYHVDDWKLKHIGVNLSAIQCMQPELPGMIERVTAEYGVTPGVLAFEVTETEAAGSLAVVRRNMETIAGMGYFFLLDDFGTGYANFSYIADLPFTCVKIDKCLLWQAMDDPAKLALLTGVMGIFKRLELESVCEGIETRAHAELVTRLGIDMQQGYLYSKALPPDKLIEYAAARRRAV